MAESMSDTGIHSKELVPVERVKNVQNINELPNEIFDRLFRLLDKASLRQSRLVCTKWEDVALKILSQTGGRVAFRFENDAGINEKGLEDIGKLQSILHSTTHPGMFFTKLSLNSPEGWEHYKHGVLVREMPLLNLLQNFGSTLKCLILDGITLHLTIFRPLIEKWWANLEELKFIDIIVIEDDSMNIHDFESPPTPLKLNLRKFTFRDGSEDEEEKAPANLILSIIKNSPKLQCLDAEMLPKEPDLWAKIQNLHDTTKNLEEIKIEINEASDFILMSNISLSDKFKSLSVGIHCPLFDERQLVTLLKTVEESLEKLCLGVDSDDDDVVVEEFSWKIELPSMKKLKVLRHCTKFQLGFEPMDFLKKLPSLEMLTFSGAKCDLLLLESENVNTWFRNCSSLTRHPHKTLNTLHVRGSPTRPETIVAINQMFPNLRELSLVLDGGEIPQETKESWLISVFQGFSEMRNLKILSVNFLLWFHENSGNAGIDFHACFSPLEASQSLENLEMLSDIIYRCPMYFPPGLEKIFANIPNLKVLTLEGLQIKNLYDARNLFKTLDEKGIIINLF